MRPLTIIVGLLFFLGIITAFILWAYDYPVSPTQVMLTVFIVLAGVAIYLLYKLLGGKVRGKQGMSVDQQYCMDWWNKFKVENLTPEFSAGKTRKYTGVGKFRAFLFRKRESNMPVIIIYSVDDRDVWDYYDSPGSELIADPFKDFKPEESRQTLVKEKGGKYIPLGVPTEEIKEPEEVEESKS